jgi:hypothetical protein
MSNFSIAVPSTVYSCSITASATGVSAWSSGVLTVASAQQSANAVLLPLNNLYPQSSRIVGISGGNATTKYRVAIGAPTPQANGNLVANQFAPSVVITSSNSGEALATALTIYWVNEIASSPNFGGDVGTNSFGVATAPVAIQPC